MLLFLLFSFLFEFAVSFLCVFPSVGLFVLFMSCLPAVGPPLYLTPIATSAWFFFWCLVSTMSCDGGTERGSLCLKRIRHKLGVSTPLFPKVWSMIEGQTTPGPVFYLDSEGGSGGGAWKEQASCNRASN